MALLQDHRMTYRNPSHQRLPDLAAAAAAAETVATPEAIAQVLYRHLRAMDESEGQALLVLLPSLMEQLAQEKGWEAVIDRIERAGYATKHG
ncbi:MAG: hypothetical protein EBV84_07365, partial [Betaproteobacteria bacterium]|nr:hypothetical protein [Betaproteobacteria bacterium]